MGCLPLEEQCCQNSSNCWQAGRGKDGKMEARHRAEPNVRPLLLSLDGVDGSSLTAPSHSLMTARTHPEVSQSVCASPNGDFESGALPKTSRGDGCRGGRCSPVGVDPATQGELFTVEPRCPRKAAEPGSEARHDANRGPKLGSMPPRPTGKVPARVTESPQRFRTLARERGGASPHSWGGVLGRTSPEREENGR